MDSTARAASLFFSGATVTNALVSENPKIVLVAAMTRVPQGEFLLRLAAFKHCKQVEGRVGMVRSPDDQYETAAPRE